MTIKERYAGVIEWFEQNMAQAETELNYRNGYELLVAVILSAQCTDKRVNIVTPALFERFPTPQDMAASSVEEIYSLIKSISYPNNKAKNLWAMARNLTEEFGGELPRDLERLQELPGVGEVLAQNILALRQKLGGFTAVSQLLEVDDLGAVTYDKIKNLVRIGEN